MKNIQKHVKVNTPGIFREIVEFNDGCAIFATPLMWTKAILAEVAERAIELNDPVLLAHMMRLSLLSVSDPESPDFDQKLVSNYIDKYLA